MRIEYGSFSTVLCSFIFGLMCSGAAGRAQEPDPEERCLPCEEVSGLPMIAQVGFDLFDDSNTGYIDNAVIASRFRIRFDGAFDADRPDRAEFFYGKCDCFTLRAGQSGAGSPGPVGGGPGGDLDYEEIRVYFEYAVRPRFSLFFEAAQRSLDGRAFSPGAVAEGVPGAISGADPADDLVPFSESGFGDINLGFKYGLVARGGRAVTLQVRAYLPTGDAKKGLGNDHESLEPALLWFERLNDRWDFESEALLWLPLAGSSDPVTVEDAQPGTTVVINRGKGRVITNDDGSFNDGSADPVNNHDFAGEILRLGVGLSRRSAKQAGLRFSPVAEVVGWYVMSGFKAAHLPLLPTGRRHFEEAGGDTIVNLKLGGRIRGNGRSSVYLGYGFALTDQVWYQGIARVEYRIELGGPAS